MLAFSLLYVLGRGIPVVDGALFGIKAAVLVIVVEALIRIGRRSLKSRLLIGLAAAAFVGIFFLDLPFPLIVALAAVDRLLHDPSVRRPPVGSQSRAAGGRRRSPTLVGLVLWWAPVALAVLLLGKDHVFVDIGVFFSKLAVVSFGGAYALLAYMAQQAVENYGWMSAPEMVDGLGLAETLPGPLIKVTQFVGFLGAYRSPRAVHADCERGPRLGADHLGHVRAADAADLRRRAVRRAAALEPAPVGRARRDHRRGGRA